MTTELLKQIRDDGPQLLHCGICGNVNTMALLRELGNWPAEGNSLQFFKDAANLSLWNWLIKELS